MADFSHFGACWYFVAFRWVRFYRSCKVNSIGGVPVQGDTGIIYNCYGLIVTWAWPLLCFDFT
jgi:hypothetical protein